MRNQLGVSKDDDKRTAADATASFEMKQALTHCQSAFQGIVAHLGVFDFTPTVERRIIPAQTEAYRLLRLANVNAIRLSAAKQPETVERLRSQLLSQTESVIGFVQVIKSAVEEDGSDAN